VIPDGDLDAFSTRLSGLASVSVGQHGVDHVNRRPAGEPPSEYPGATSMEAIAAKIIAGRDAMRSAGLEPCFFTPPWNAVQPELPAALDAAGYAVLCAGDDTVDVLRWKGGPRFKGSTAVLRGIRRRLKERRQAGAFARPVGLLTHHLAHDAPTWRFLEVILPWLDQRVEWVGVGRGDV
jgi:hypothetical protein